MAVARLNKLKILVHKSQKDELLKVLQREGSVEVIDLSSRPRDGAWPAVQRLETRDEKESSGDLDRLAWLGAFLSEADPAKRYTATKEEIEDIIKKFDYSGLYAECVRIDEDIRSLNDKGRLLLNEKEALEPWANLNVDLGEISKTPYTARGLGIMKKDAVEALKNDAGAEGLDLYLDVVNESREDAYILCVFLRQDEKKASGLFKKHGLNHTYFPNYSKSPSSVLEELNVKTRDLQRRRSSALKELVSLSKERKSALIYYDYLRNVRAQDEAAKNLLATEEVYIIEGWVREKEAPRLKKSLEGAFSEMEIWFEEPSAGDDVPVILENWKILEPFEFITKIYGLPAYNEVDPTPFLAPFFFIFFGFCITDAAYGAILAILSLWVLGRFKMGWQGSRFFRLLLYGGISTILLGAVTGGWFGDLIDVAAGADGALAASLKAVKDSLILLDPMKDPMKLLIIALTLGVIQIWSGNIVAIYGNLRNRRYLDALLDQGSTLLFLLGFSGLILIFLDAIPKDLARPFSILAMLGSLAIIATQGRSNPGIGSKLFFGIYALYNTFSGYLSDILSYCRLWALGLVTGVMASTVNLIAVLMGNMIPVVGLLVGAAILLGGHVITLVMNLLGAFVHPSRLQFVEFFTKFFKGGGRDFKPLRIENRFTEVK